MSIKLSCPRHPRYSAKISPKANCSECIVLYVLKLQAEAARIKVG